jgi:hypothetical protein
LRRAYVGLLLLAAAVNCRADPWLAPGDEGIRHDIQLLADAGILRGPVTTWPISWPDIARDAGGARAVNLDAATADALWRVQRLGRAAAARGFSGAGVRMAAAYKPAIVRGFAETPREEGEAGLRASWLGDHVALNLQATYAVDPDDDSSVRADGSYLGVNVGNFMISAGYMERWWGPGWDGSLILSTNTRPIPSVTLERNYTDPFRTPLLSWMGPWRASIAVGQAQGSEEAIRNVRFLAMRANFKPRPWLELGFTRTAQWCGGDRVCGFETFTDMLVGRDNQIENGTTDTQPGNQMAGYDMRLRSPWRPLPLAFYTQWIGEDEAGGLPSKFIGLFGLETWFGSAFGGVRIRMEYADTACSFTRQEPEFNCAYRNTIYPQGYTYRQRIIGHSIDNDSRMYTLAALLTQQNGNVLSLALRRVNLNRDGVGAHSVSSAPVDLDNVELRYSSVFGIGKVNFGASYDDGPGTSDRVSGIRGFVTWQQGF